MYIVVEGMPCTGKSTIAKELAKRTNSKYIKTSLSNSEFGFNLRKIISLDRYGEQVEYYYLMDLIFDELEVDRLFDSKSNIVRDKCFASTYSYLKVVNCEVKDECLRKMLFDGYEKVSRLAKKPDLVVYLKPNMQKIKENFMNKNDLSEWDKAILANPSNYFAQDRELLAELKQVYGDRLLIVESFSKDVDSMVKHIIDYAKNEKSFEK